MKIIIFFLIILCSFPVGAESFTFDLGNTQGSMIGRIIQLFLLVTVLGVAPSLIMMITSFTRIVVVFGFARNAMGIQQSPPNMVLLSLAMFLTLFIMLPTFEKAYEEGISPLIEGKIKEEQAFEKVIKPFQGFMLKNVREKDLKLFMDFSKIPKVSDPKEIPIRVLIPAFIISELKRAFEIGFLIFVPFLIIDMVIASILMSMGMMMLPPVMIALPFKIIFFVVIDGWYLLCSSLLQSFNL